ncbi:MAG: hypothetical protein LBQ47_07980 [Endomicrobium sp.]|jgi:predicted Fe-Mo cluster-binding NifX family protein|nr:hypothetical protein [Endomicrobium sp.]
MSKIKIALASSDGKFIDKHFGKAESWRIAELNTQTKEYREIEIRQTPKLCQENGHSAQTLAELIKILSDCKYVFVLKIGIWIVSELKSKGIKPVEFFGSTQNAADFVFKELKV